MSQQKVDKYKEEKKNRKKNMKKEKARQSLAVVVAAAIGVAIIGYIGYSAYDAVTGHAQSEAESETVTTQVDPSAISDYMSELYGES